MFRRSDSINCGLMFMWKWAHNFDIIQFEIGKFPIVNNIIFHFSVLFIVIKKNCNNVPNMHSSIGWHQHTFYQCRSWFDLRTDDRSIERMTIRYDSFAQCHPFDEFQSNIHHIIHPQIISIIQLLPNIQQTMMYHIQGYWVFFLFIKKTTTKTKCCKNN